MSNVVFGIGPTFFCVIIGVLVSSTAFAQNVQTIKRGRQPNQGVPQQGAPNQPAAQPTAPLVTITTIEDKQYQAKDAEFKDGKITIKSDPPQSVALEDMQRVVFLHESTLALEWVGQNDRDLVQIGAADGGNGVRDVQIRATGLTAKAIKQIAIISRKQFRVWRLDVSNSPFWKVAVERVGQASLAEFFFEPPRVDLFDSEVEVTVTYDDNTTSNAKVKATTHTSDQKNPEYPPEKLALKGARVATIYGQGGDLFNGRVLRADAEQFMIETSWQPLFEVPFAQVRGIFFDGSKSDVKLKFDQQMAKPGENDLIQVLSKDGGIAEVSGRLQGLNDGVIRVLHDGQQKKIRLDRVQAIVLADHAASRGWQAPYQTFRMASGDLFSASLMAIEEKSLKLRSPWGPEITVPRETLVEITGRNTRMVNLSELTPVSEEQVPYFDRKMSFVKDKSWNDRPLKLDGKTYSRGLAMHSRCILTYELNGQFASFRAIVGFEEEAGTRGRVVCRVLADDQEVFSKPDFRAVEKPVIVQVSVKGAKQLRLEVDFGEDEDIGDRVIWANARLFRE